MYLMTNIKRINLFYLIKSLSRYETNLHVKIFPFASLSVRVMISVILSCLHRKIFQYSSNAEYMESMEVLSALLPLAILLAVD